jgi:hypothetical protein
VLLVSWGSERCDDGIDFRDVGTCHVGLNFLHRADGSKRLQVRVVTLAADGSTAGWCLSAEAMRFRLLY